MEQYFQYCQRAMLTGVLVIAIEEPLEKPEGRKVMISALSLRGTAQKVAQGLMLLAVTCSSWGQEQQVLEEIVVTAQKRIERLIDVPSSISALGEEDIAKFDIQDPKDLYAVVPNLTADTPMGGVFPRIFLRGLGSTTFTGNGSSSVSIYYDEIVQALPMLQGFPAFDLDRIEILRGPQGTLWGRNTTGGLAHFVSKKPTHEFDGYGKFSYGSFDEIEMEGAIGGSLVDGRLAARVSLLFDQRDGWVENTFDGSKLQGHREAAARMQFLFTPSESIDVLLNLHGRFFDGDFLLFHNCGLGPGGVDEAGDINPCDPDVINSDFTDPFLEADQQGASLNVNWHLPNFVITSITGYEEGGMSGQVDDDGGPLPTEVVFQEAPDNAQFSQEIRISSARETALEWIAGAYFISFDVKNHGLAIVGFDGGLFGEFGQRADFTQNNESIAVFGHVNYDLSDKLRLAGGARWTEDQKDIVAGGVFFAPDRINPFDPRFADPISIATDVPTTRLDKTWSEVTWEVAATYALSANKNAYVRVARGFRAGNFDARAAFGASVKAVNPEILLDIEGGLKGRWLDDRLSLNIGAFYYDYDDPQLTIVPGAAAIGIEELINAPGGSVVGGEVEVELLVIDQLLLTGNLGLAFSEYSDDEPFLTPIPGQPDNIRDAGGNEFIRSPEATSTLTAQYNVPLGRLGTGYIYTSWTYTDNVFFNLLNDDVPETSGVVGPGLMEDAYWLGNLRLGYLSPSEKFEIVVWGKNITDEERRTFAFGPFVGAFHPNFIDPSTYGITATVEFQ